jgi:hypothetical protein
MRFKHLEKDFYRGSRSKATQKKNDEKPSSVKQPLKPTPLADIADPFLRELVARDRKERGISES